MIKRLTLALLGATLLTASMNASADMPYISGNLGQDTEHVQVGDLVCETSRAVATGNVGTWGSNGSSYSWDDDEKRPSEVGVFAAVSFPLGQSKTTNCSYIQALGEQQLKLKIQELQEQIQNMKNTTYTIK